MKKENYVSASAEAIGLHSSATPAASDGKTVMPWDENALKMIALLTLPT